MRVLESAASNIRILGVVLAIVATFGTTFGLALTATGAFASHADPNELHACVNPLSRVMRHVDDPDDCAYYEEVVSWDGSTADAPVYDVRFESLPITSMVSLSNTTECASGETAVSGGGYLDNGTRFHSGVTFGTIGNGPVGDPPTGWITSLDVDAVPSDPPATATFWVICVS